MQMVSLDEDELIQRLLKLQAGELLAMYEAAAEALQCFTALAQSGQNPVTAILDGASAVEEWAHFPPGDAVDPGTQSRYFYHAHAAHERVADEHGHFHTFMSPDALAPASQGDAVGGDQSSCSSDPSCDRAPRVTHLVGISTDARGNIIRLFTTNRWVTGKIWHAAEDVIGMLDRFEMSGERPSADVNGWVTAVIRMFRPQIVDLIRVRDANLAAFQSAHPDVDIYEERSLHVTSEMAVDFLAQIRAIEAAIESQPAS
jgi:hypothetical protein